MRILAKGCSVRCGVGVRGTKARGKRGGGVMGEWEETVWGRRPSLLTKREWASVGLKMSNVDKYYSATSIVYHKLEIKNLILRNLVKQVWMFLFNSITTLPTMYFSYFLWICRCCLWALIWHASQVHITKQRSVIVDIASHVHIWHASQVHITVQTNS
jgi:hypothetical protein